ncbi:unnamed protein product [Thelazia callipaeda]|uniref:DCAF15_WD40 domain-containing protein n=1 Tax=Thelazia callipaeda TaxID=103827 RepID=A0A0N5CRE0_THECL|nr:unnamed protein product [Thelazia callipaeda]
MKSRIRNILSKFVLHTKLNSQGVAVVCNVKNDVGYLWNDYIGFIRVEGHITQQLKPLTAVEFHAMPSKKDSTPVYFVARQVVVDSEITFQSDVLLFKRNAEMKKNGRVQVGNCEVRLLNIACSFRSITGSSVSVLYYKEYNNNLSGTGIYATTDSDLIAGIKVAVLLLSAPLFVSSCNGNNYFTTERCSVIESSSDEEYDDALEDCTTEQSSSKIWQDINISIPITIETVFLLRAKYGARNHQDIFMTISDNDTDYSFTGSNIDHTSMNENDDLIDITGNDTDDSILERKIEYMNSDEGNLLQDIKILTSDSDAEDLFVESKTDVVYSDETDGIEIPIFEGDEDELSSGGRIESVNSNKDDDIEDPNSQSSADVPFIGSEIKCMDLNKDDVSKLWSLSGKRLQNKIESYEEDSSDESYLKIMNSSSEGTSSDEMDHIDILRACELATGINNICHDDMWDNQLKKQMVFKAEKMQLQNVKIIFLLYAHKMLVFKFFAALIKSAIQRFFNNAILNKQLNLASRSELSSSDANNEKQIADEIQSQLAEKSSFDTNFNESPMNEIKSDAMWIEEVDQLCIDILSNSRFRNFVSVNKEGNKVLSEIMKYVTRRITSNEIAAELGIPISEVTPKCFNAIFKRKAAELCRKFSGMVGFQRITDRQIPNLA